VPRIETLIELSHRISSGVAVVLSVALLGWAIVSYPAGHSVRRGAAAVTAFMFAEALIGAALVLFELVAHDQSMKRALSVCLHLGNTFLLLASTALTAWWASGGAPIRLRSQGMVAWAMGIPLVLTLVVGATGAVTALGDTLFPAPSLAAGFAQDLSPNAHVLLRLRALHPMLAAANAVATLVALSIVRALRPSGRARALARIASVLVIAQVALGLLDMMALAPVWMQLAHLVGADALWVALVLTAAAALAGGPVRTLEPPQERRREFGPKREPAAATASVAGERASERATRLGMGA
jgi:heme A synthase